MTGGTVTKFEDATGREWELSLTAGDLKRLKRDLSVDLRNALKPDGGTLTAVLDDTEKFLEPDVGPMRPPGTNTAQPIRNDF